MTRIESPAAMISDDDSARGGGGGVTTLSPSINGNHRSLSDLPPAQTIVFPTQSVGKPSALPPPENSHRAIHKIRYSALSHNYGEVESAANRQRCSVIVVVKADGYGHGAIASALYLADHAGADAFAVATLEEGIALRKAFQQTQPGAVQTVASTTSITSLFPQEQTVADTTSVGGATTVMIPNSMVPPKPVRNLRSQHIRILVLGPPVNFPRCFDDYYHWNIECMVSGPEVAQALREWVYNTEERKRIQVERAATESKQLALQQPQRPVSVISKAKVAHHLSTMSSNDDISSSDSKESQESVHSLPAEFRPVSATLSNVSGQDLAKEVRSILMNQQLAAENHQHQMAQKQANGKSQSSSRQPSKSGSSTPVTSGSTPTPSLLGDSSGLTTSNGSRPLHAGVSPNTTAAANGGPTKTFAGIEEAAKVSRTQHKLERNRVLNESTDSMQDAEDEAGDWQPLSKSIPTNTNVQAIPKGRVLKRLRWHAMVDSGMGRLGFRTDPIQKEDVGKRRDTVQILQELVDLETSHFDCPVEFFGMCTHMAEASSSSDYTNTQISKFKNLLRRVRTAGISVPTVSTDNSAALLTTSLNHFDAKELLSQENADTRGFVRTGGAIYGQRPSFPQLKAVSTLMASVRHVAVLKQGESVGYDRAYIAPMNVRIATLAIGFADGYPRELGNGVGQVAIRGHLFPVAGNVCMDMLMVELGPAGDTSGAGAQVVVGDTGILWGPADDEEGEGLVRLQDIASRLKTTQSALTCGLDKVRVMRQYG